MIMVICRIVSSSSSSDEEIFVKSKSKHLHDVDGGARKAYENSRPASVGPRAILSERSPDMTHAEWAIQNMSQSPGLSVG